jgi:hypothetical protein
VVTVLFIAWLLFQAIASQSLFEWLGDRIDNLTEETVGVTTLIRTPLFAVLCEWCGATP